MIDDGGDVKPRRDWRSAFAHIGDSVAKLTWDDYERWCKKRGRMASPAEWNSICTELAREL